VKRVDGSRVFAYEAGSFHVVVPCGEIMGGLVMERSLDKKSEEDEG